MSRFLSRLADRVAGHEVRVSLRRAARFEPSGERGVGGIVATPSGGATAPERGTLPAGPREAAGPVEAWADPSSSRAEPSAATDEPAGRVPDARAGEGRRPANPGSRESGSASPEGWSRPPDEPRGEPAETARDQAAPWDGPVADASPGRADRQPAADGTRPHDTVTMPAAVDLVKEHVVEYLVARDVLARDEAVVVLGPGEVAARPDARRTRLIMTTATRRDPAPGVTPGAASEIHLHIDRIEVVRPVAPTPPVPAPTTARRTVPRVDHEAYLARRREPRP